MAVLGNGADGAGCSGGRSSVAESGEMLLGKTSGGKEGAAPVRLAMRVWGR